MRSARISAVAFGLALLIGTRHDARAQAGAVEAAITQQANEFLAAWNAHDLAKTMAFFEGPKGWFFNGGLAIPSTDSLRSYFKAQMDLRASDESKWTRTKVFPLGADAAYFQGVYGGRVTYKDGRTVEWVDNAVMTLFFERRPGGWKVTSFHGSAGSSRAVPK